MPTIAIYGKKIDVNNIPYLQELITQLEKEQCNILFFSTFYENSREHLHFQSTPKQFSSYHDLAKEKISFLFSIGGDGTILDTITLIRNLNIPIVGINLGRLGFLSSIPKEDIKRAIHEVIHREFSIEEHSLIKMNTTENLFGITNFALNEVSIHKNENNTMLNVRVDINGEFLNTYWADGLIIATPTGSTAYSMSCGGPIVPPNANNFIITPISSHNLTVRPIVIPDNSVLSIEILGRNHKFSLGLDSRYIFMEQPIKIELMREQFTIKILRLENETFFTALRKKLHWGLDIRN